MTATLLMIIGGILIALGFIYAIVNLFRGSRDAGESFKSLNSGDFEDFTNRATSRFRKHMIAVLVCGLGGLTFLGGLLWYLLPLLL